MCPEREIKNYEIEKWYPLRVGYYVQIIDGYFYIHLQDGYYHLLLQGLQWR